jgi:SAM-dependent methyltransferase
MVGMPDMPENQVQGYLLDGEEEDLRRLLAISETHAEIARTALHRAGIAPGWSVIECGCGPLGALPQLAQLVGEAGHVTGVDLNPQAARRAQAATAALGLGNVRVLAADVHELTVASAGGPFDLAYTRLFLAHARDPVRTLRHVRGLLKPGGWLIAQEPLRRPLPQAFPHLDAVPAAWELMADLIERSGVPAGTVERLHHWAAAAGFEVIQRDGAFAVGDSVQYFGLWATSLTAMRDRSVATGLTTGEDIDALVATLTSADPAAYEWITSPIYLDLTLRNPA